MLVLNCLLEMEDQRQASWRRVCLWKTVQGDPWNVFSQLEQASTGIFPIFHPSPPHRVRAITHSPGWQQGVAQHERWDLSTIPEPLPKKTPPAAGASRLFYRNSHKFPQIQAKAALPSPEPLGLQGLGAAHCHSVHGEIQKLFKCYNLCCIST